MNLILTNAVVRTMEETSPLADTVAIRDGRIAWVGWQGEAPDMPGLRRVDLAGKTIIPGLLDAHSHPALVGMSGWHVRLPESDDLETLLDFIRSYAELHPKEEAPYLYFEYYSPALFAGGEPTRQMLDRAISDRPVLCQDGGDHASWVNSRMLELLGVGRETPDPVPGLEMFIRDEEGNPTGYVLENAHVHFLPRMFEALAWSPPEAPTAQNIAPVLTFLSSRGVVAVFDALIESPEVIQVINDLDRRGELPVHYEGAVRFRTLEDLPKALELVRSLDGQRTSDRVRVRTVKLFLDGTNELGTGAVLEPLLGSDGPGPRGSIQMECVELTRCLEMCNEAGVDIHIHMVGDRAFRTACDAVEAAQSARRRARSPWRMQVTFAHCELMDPSDMDRPAELGIIINWTNHWAGGYFGDEAIRYLGEDRWMRMYDFERVIESGATVAFSSDVVSSAELHRADPFFGMQIAATRVDPETPLDAHRWPGGERPAASAKLSVDRLLQGYTINAARQMRIDDTFGKIAAGRPAHLVVLDRDPVMTPADRLGEIVPVAVLFDGSFVHGSL